jgi:hypothetical protein
LDVYRVFSLKLHLSAGYVLDLSVVLWLSLLLDQLVLFFD